MCVSSVRPRAKLSPTPGVCRHAHLAVYPGAEDCFPTSDDASVSSRRVYPSARRSRREAGVSSAVLWLLDTLRPVLIKEPLHQVTKEKLQNRPRCEAGRQGSAAVQNERDRAS